MVTVTSIASLVIKVFKLVSLRSAPAWEMSVVHAGAANGDQEEFDEGAERTKPARRVPACAQGPLPLRNVADTDSHQASVRRLRSPSRKGHAMEREPHPARYHGRRPEQKATRMH